jgi:hypothetical protein
MTASTEYSLILHPRLDTRFPEAVDGPGRHRPPAAREALPRTRNPEKEAVAALWRNTAPYRVYTCSPGQGVATCPQGATGRRIDLFV